MRLGAEPFWSTKDKPKHVSLIGARFGMKLSLISPDRGMKVLYLRAQREALGLKFSMILVTSS
jgi:hypothetical protein